MRAVPSPSRTAPRPAKKGRSGRRVLFLQFAPATCIEMFRRSCPARSPASFALPPNFIQHAYVRMIQAGNGFGFALEPLLTHRIGRKVRRQNLYGHGAVEPRVLRTVHFAHSASPERSADLIGPKFCARNERHDWP